MYDPRLGSTAADSAGPGGGGAPPCVTCSNGYVDCPGHFGHIELVVPVYHPLLFFKILNILRMKCFYCHKLRAPKRVLEVLQAKFMLLQMKQYSQAKSLDDTLASSMAQGRLEKYKDNGGGVGGSSNKKKGNDIEHSGIVMDRIIKDIFHQHKVYMKEHNRHEHEGKLSLESSYEGEYYRELIQELTTQCKGGSRGGCPNCGAHSPKIRQDSSNKFFQAPLSTKAKKMNASEGIILKPALTKQRSSRSSKKGDDDDGGEDDDVDDEGSGEGGGYDSDDSMARRRRLIDSEAVEVDDVEEDDDDEPTEGGDGGGRDKFMHASEVQAQIQRTWATNPHLCNVAFAFQGPDIFFMQAIPVPPNRFRPPMQLGGMLVEHVQNQFLSKILLSNELIRTHFASNSEAEAYKQWIQLQTLVNCFMDNSKDPSASANAHQQPGIRQLLERKEGIFRKHMMGKRVNYACRSVISPDPYVGTNEIGLPRYFAETLTYPTPVTEINIEEMKTLVERGPKQYPGARWIEFPNTRRGRVNLEKMNDHQREAMAAQLLAHAKKGGRPAIVGRQLRDGDMVLMNRQVRIFGPSVRLSVCFLVFYVSCFC